MIGNWFEERKNRDKIILATKVAGPGPSWIRGGGNQFNAKNMSEALEGSLKRLQTDYSIYINYTGQNDPLIFLASLDISIMKRKAIGQLLKIFLLQHKNLLNKVKFVILDYPMKRHMAYQNTCNYLMQRNYLELFPFKIHIVF
jgi:hypothetical protein